MADVFKEEEGEEQTKEQWQGAETVFCEVGQVKNAVYEEQVRRNEAEHVLVECRGHVVGREEGKDD